MAPLAMFLRAYGLLLAIAHLINAERQMLKTADTNVLRHIVLEQSAVSSMQVCKRMLQDAKASIVLDRLTRAPIWRLSTHSMQGLRL